MDLLEIGWDDELRDQLQALGDPSLEPARVAREDRGRYLVLGEFGEAPAETAGRLRHDASKRSDLPAVGDWVAVRRHGPGDPGTIRGVLPRRSLFLRKAAGTSSRSQVLAANVDVAFVVTGLDGDYSLRRIERYLTLTERSGARPVVVLNKTDLCEDPDLRVREVEGVADLAPVLAVSAALGAGVPALRAHLGTGCTGVFLGSSGVGKSTLVNRLVGEDLLATRDTRASDSKGRHTTTRRELILLPDDGGVVIDTPGLREIQLRGGAGALAGAFSDVEELAAACRFRDCRHEDEPGCAVRDALREGSLDRSRYESYLEQRRELAHQLRRSDQRARQAEKARWRKITMDYRKTKKYREGRG